jgi:beta-mannosidase
MVWQDFPFACAMYPEEEPFWSEVEAEARENVARISSHPSLAIWNGCNENLWAYRDWGWKDHPDIKDAKRTWGKGYYFDLLPRVCEELTPTVPYWAGSPWSGDYDVDHGVPPNAATHGNKHVWEAWFKEDYGVYRMMSPRFCSEFGFQGPATYASIASVVAPEDRDFGSRAMRHHQKSGDPVRDDGDRRNLRHLIRHFNLDGAEELLAALDASVDKKGKVPECGAGPLTPSPVLPSRVNFDDLHYLLQLNQARALTLGVEWFRSRSPVCMGTLYWQLNDCWPGVTSWSCIDGDGRRKPLWYATRRFYADQLLTIQPKPDGSLWLHLINDTDHAVERVVHVVRRDFAGRVLADSQMTLRAAPRATTKEQIDPNVATPMDPTREFLATDGAGRATWFFDLDRNLHYPRPGMFDVVEFIRRGKEYRLTIRAGTLLRDVCVFADRLDPAAEVSEQLVTLLPEESFTFAIRSSREPTAEQLTAAPVFQCANRFGAPS